MNTKLYVEGYQLDLEETIPVPLNLQVVDIKDLDKRISEFSKTIRVPGTKNNNKILGNVFNLQLQYPSGSTAPNINENFSPKRKASAIIETENIALSSGYIQLREVKTENDRVWYDIVFYGTLSDIISSISGKMVSELDLSLYDHDLNFTAVTGSWAGDSIVYPFVDYGHANIRSHGEVNIGNLKPALSLRSYIDQIFEESNFTYDAPFFDTQEFNNLFLPYNGIDDNTLTEDEEEAISMVASKDSIIRQYDANGTEEVDATDERWNIDRDLLDSGNLNTDTSPAGLFKRYSFITPEERLYDINFTLAIAFETRYNGTRTDENTDSYHMNGLYEYKEFHRLRPSLRIYDINGNDVTTQRMFDTAIQRSVDLANEAVTYDNINSGSITDLFDRKEVISGYQASQGGRAQITRSQTEWEIGKEWEISYSFDRIYLEVGDAVGPWFEWWSPKEDMGPSANPGSVTRVVQQYGTNDNPSIWYENDDSFQARFRFKPDSNMEVVPTPSQISNFTITDDDFKLVEVEQKDLLLSTLKLFNLIAVPDPENSRNIIIRDRDRYFRNGEIKDWTNKVDKSRQTSLTPVRDPNVRRWVYEWEGGNDFYSNLYEDQVGKSYGEVKIDNNSEFGKDDNKNINVTFESAPSVKYDNDKIFGIVGTFPLYVDKSLYRVTNTDDIREVTGVGQQITIVVDGTPYTRTIERLTETDIGLDTEVGQAIANTQYGCIINNTYDRLSLPSYKGKDDNVGQDPVETNPKLTYYSGVKTCNTYNLTSIIQNVDKGEYPLISHLNDEPSADPTFDYNFGRPDRVYFGIDNYPTDNIFTEYHSQSLQEILDGGNIFEGYFNLTNTDIINLKYNDKIYIEGQLYRINRVKDFDLTSERPTKIELVKLTTEGEPELEETSVSVSNVSPQIAQPSNLVEIGGSNFQSIVYPTSRVFAFYSLDRTLVERDQNFLNLIHETDETGSLVSPTYEVLGGLTGVKTGGTFNEYIKTDPDINAGYTNVGLLGENGENTHTVAFRFRFEGEPDGELFFAGVSGSYERLYINASNKVVLERFDATNGTETVTSTTTVQSNEWYSLALRYNSDPTIDNELWLGYTKEGTFNNLSLDVPIADVDSLYIGYNPLTSTPTDGYFATWRITQTYVSGEDFDKLRNDGVLEINLLNMEGFSTSTIDPKWVVQISDNKLLFTVPQMSTNDRFPSGKYKMTLRSGNIISRGFSFTVEDVPLQDTEIDLNLSDTTAFENTFGALEKAWGGDNGGVVADNIEFEMVKGTQELAIYANGDQYTGSITGVDNLGNPIDRKDRVGGVITSDKYWGFGKYTVEAKIPTLLGVAPAFWTFHYEEIYPGDPRWEQFTVDEQLPISGDETQGFYVVRNHEIDIEFPSQLPTEDIQVDASLDNQKLNSWRGELQDWDTTPRWNNPDYSETYRDWKWPVIERVKNQMTETEKTFVSTGTRWSNFGGSSLTFTQNQDIVGVISGSATRVQSTGGTDRRKYRFVDSKDADYAYYLGFWCENNGSTTVSITANAVGFPTVDVLAGELKYVHIEAFNNNNQFCSIDFRTAASGDSMDLTLYDPQYKEGGQRGTTQKTPVQRLDVPSQQMTGSWAPVNSYTGSVTTDSIDIEGTTETGYNVQLTGGTGDTQYQYSFSDVGTFDDFLYDGMTYKFGTWVENKGSSDLTVAMSGSVVTDDSFTVIPGDTKYVRLQGVCNNATGSINIELQSTSDINSTFYEPILAEYTIDGYREYGWKWNADTVQFFVDGQYQRDILNNIDIPLITDLNDTGYQNSFVVPDIVGRMNIGLWFPSAGNGRNWAGDENGEAPWERQKMNVRRVKFTPETDSGQLARQRVIGETYGSNEIANLQGITPGAQDSETEN